MGNETSCASGRPGHTSVADSTTTVTRQGRSLLADALRADFGGLFGDADDTARADDVRHDVGVAPRGRHPDSPVVSEEEDEGGSGGRGGGGGEEWGASGPGAAALQMEMEAEAANGCDQHDRQRRLDRVQREAAEEEQWDFTTGLGDESRVEQEAWAQRAQQVETTAQQVQLKAARRREKRTADKRAAVAQRAAAERAAVAQRAAGERAASRLEQATAMFARGVARGFKARWLRPSGRQTRRYFFVPDTAGAAVLLWFNGSTSIVHASEAEQLRKCEHINLGDVTAVEEGELEDGTR